VNVHVMPVGDLIEHEPLERCVCGPSYEHVQGEDGESGWVITHHSLDGREKSESQADGS
jgi:hypothetical protein